MDLTTCDICNQLMSYNPSGVCQWCEEFVEEDDDEGEECDVCGRGTYRCTGEYDSPAVYTEGERWTTWN